MLSRSFRVAFLYLIAEDDSMQFVLFSKFKISIELLFLALVSSFIFYKFDEGNSFKLCSPTMLSCIKISVFELFSFGYGDPCCCTLDHQPLYLVFLKFWSSIFGTSLFSVKFFSYIFYILSMFSIFLVGKKVFKQPLLYYVFPIIFILNGSFQDLSNYVYMYIHYFFFLTLAVYVLAQDHLNTEQKFFWSLLVLFVGALTFYITYMYWGLLLVIYVLWFRDITSRRLYGLILVSSIFFLAKTPVILLFRFVERDTHSYVYSFYQSYVDIVTLLIGGKGHSKLDHIFKLFICINSLIGFYLFQRKDHRKILVRYFLLTTIVSICIYGVTSLLLRLDEIKVAYFVFWIFVFNFSIFYFYSKILSRLLQMIFLGIHIYVLLVSAGHTLKRDKYNSFDQLVEKVQQFIGPNTQEVFYLNGDAKYWLEGIYESKFQKRLEFKNINLISSFCPTSETVYFIDTHRDSLMGMDILMKMSEGCSVAYSIQQTDKISIDSFPHRWIIVRLKRDQ